MYEIREMQIDDLDQVLPIEEENFSVPWTANGFFTFLIREDALFLVAEEEGEILGYLGIIISIDEGEITNICVAEKARRRGIGRALLVELIQRMEAQGVSIIHLDVRQSNLPAITLYQSLGFEQDGLRRQYYDLPKEDAILMSRKSGSGNKSV
ncbi:MAG: ribosomal protein S18-alanine N-acetyltransferase [Fusicatenibacter sp.]|nr:ribosomal protein S18-alanine N-acetyltransferase [Fusicatenibacter sp.]